MSRTQNPDKVTGTVLSQVSVYTILGIILAGVVQAAADISITDLNSGGEWVAFVLSVVPLVAGPLWGVFLGAAGVKRVVTPVTADATPLDLGGNRLVPEVAERK